MSFRTSTDISLKSPSYPPQVVGSVRTTSWTVEEVLTTSVNGCGRMRGGNTDKSVQGARTISMTMVFFVIIVAFAGSMSFMSVNVRAQDIWEPDDTPAEASVILTDGTMQSHYFHQAGDVDWVTFLATLGSAYTIETHNLGMLADTEIYLIDTDQASILDTDDDGGLGLASRIYWVAPATGNYYVRVENLGGGGPTDYEYDINVMESPPAVDAYEPDNTAAEASPIPTDGSMQSHTIYMAGDEDWIVFQATEGNEYTIETHNLGSQIDTYITLYDSNGQTVLSQDDDGGLNLASKITWIALTTDNLYVMVEELGGDGNPTDYEYDINVVEVVVGPSFYISNVVRYYYAITPGESVSYDITITSLAGYAGNVDLTVTDSPGGLFPPATRTFVPATVSVPAGGSVNSVLTVDNTVGVPDDMYTLTITGDDGILARTYEAHLGVLSIPFYAISTDPYSRTISQGGIATYAVTVTSKNGFTGNVDLVLSGSMPNGLSPPATATFLPNPVAVPAGGSVTSTLTIDNTGGVTEGTYLFGIMGNPPVTTNVGVSVLTIQAGVVPLFTVSMSPPTQTIVPGDTPSYTVTVTSMNNYAGNVNLNAAAAPAGLLPPAIATFVPATVSVPAGGTATSTLTLTNTGTVAGNTYTLTVTGSDGMLMDIANADLVVNVNPYFTVSATPPTRTIDPGDTTTYTVTVTSVNNYAGNVDLGAAAMPAGLLPPATGTFIPATVTVPAGGSAASTLTVSNTGTVAEKTYTLTITGSDGALTDNDDVSLVVQTTQQTGTVGGTVEDQDNNPVNDATVELLDGTNTIDQMETSSNGEYEFTGVSPGDYTVRASKDGYVPDEKSTTLSSGGTETVNLVIELGQISGRLTDEDTGKPIKDAQVEIYDDKGELIEVLTTDDNGRFSIDLELGTYDATIKAEGHETVDRYDIELTESESDANLGTLEATPIAEDTFLGDYWWLIIVIIIVIVVVIILAAMLRKKPKATPVQPQSQPRQVQAPPPPPPQQAPPPPPPPDQ